MAKRYNIQNSLYWLFIAVAFILSVYFVIAGKGYYGGGIRAAYTFALLFSVGLLAVAYKKGRQTMGVWKSIGFAFATVWRKWIQAIGDLRKPNKVKGGKKR